MHWCFEITSTPYAEEVLDRLLVGQQAHVPVLWLYEVVSVLAKAQRSGPITADKAHGFLEDLRSLNIAVIGRGNEQAFNQESSRLLSCDSAG
jgi:predicted nucleic acid-binding protein